MHELWNSEKEFTCLSIFMSHPIPASDQPPMERLLEIMHILRAPGGCPWDAEQTHQSLLKHLIEEAYEVAEAVRGGNRDEMIDEFGDLLLQPVFHAEIASEKGEFDFHDIASAICEKLIRRHPHVFGDSDADTSEAVLQQWEEIKSREKGETDRVGPSTQQGSVVEKVNRELPALMAADKLQKKVAKVGFDWPDERPALDKIKEETGEVIEALESGDPEMIGEEIGDLLFAVVNLARKTNNDAEILLMEANDKFLKRFQQMERALRDQGKRLEESTLEEMDKEWDAAKRGKPSS